MGKRSNLGVRRHDDLAAPQERDQVPGHSPAKAIHRSVPGSLKKFHALPPCVTPMCHTLVLHPRDFRFASRFSAF
jgi:hypothetical protein